MTNNEIEEPFNLGLLQLCLDVCLTTQNWSEAEKYQARITDFIRKLNVHN
jgi:hypothetical protein